MSDPAPSSPDSGSTEDHAAEADALGGVVDDLTPKEQAADWIHAEFARGRPAESIVAEMTAGGWAQPEAAELVETVRRLTRHERGVVTRDDVARTSYVSYRRSIGRLPFIAFGGVVGIAITAANLVRSMMGLRALKRRAPDAQDSDRVA